LNKNMWVVSVFVLYLAAVGAWGAPVTVPSNFDLEGHRGARGLKPENTLPAFETALDLGVTTLELDLHLTQDGVVVIWHDDSLVKSKCRLDPFAAEPLPPDPDAPNTTKTALRISRLTFEQVQKYRCDHNPDPRRFPDQDNGPTALAQNRYAPVSLAQLFDFVKNYANDPQKTPQQQQTAQRVQFNVETKRKPNDPDAINDGFDGVNPGPFERAIVSLVEQRDLVKRVIVQSFDARSLRAVRQLNPELRLAALSSRFVSPSELEGFAAQGFTIWSPNQNTLNAQNVERAHAAGLSVIPWTVNDPNALQRLLTFGVDGVISDRPDVMLALITQR